MAVAATRTFPGLEAANAAEGEAELTERRRSVLLRSAGLQHLRRLTAGDPATRIALIDGAVARDRRLPPVTVLAAGDGDPNASNRARDHATHLASILVGQVPDLLGICPRITLLNVAAVDDRMLDGRMEPAEAGHVLAAAIRAAIDARAEVLLLGVSLHGAGRDAFGPLFELLGAAASRGIRAVIPAGNDGGLDSPAAELPGVIPVAFADDLATADRRNRWSVALARHGLLAPGTGVPGLDGLGNVVVRAGSSQAAAIVAGAYALLRAAVPRVDRQRTWESLVRRDGMGSGPIALDAQASFLALTRAS